MRLRSSVQSPFEFQWSRHSFNRSHWHTDLLLVQHASGHPRRSDSSSGITDPMLTRTVTVIAHLRAHPHGRLLILSLILRVVQQACPEPPGRFSFPEVFGRQSGRRGIPDSRFGHNRESLRESPGESGFGRDRESGPDSDWQKNRGIGICVVTVPSVRVTVPRRRDGVHTRRGPSTVASRASSMST